MNEFLLSAVQGTGWKYILRFGAIFVEIDIRSQHPSCLAVANWPCMRNVACDGSKWAGLFFVCCHVKLASFYSR